MMTLGHNVEKPRGQPGKTVPGEFPRAQSRSSGAPDVQTIRTISRRSLLVLVVFGVFLGQGLHQLVAFQYVYRALSVMDVLFVALHISFSSAADLQNLSACSASICFLWL